MRTKVLIGVSGSRDAKNYDLVEQEILRLLSAYDVDTSDIHEVWQGDCPGVDHLAARWSRTHKIPTRAWPALWRQYEETTVGKSMAGPIRNMDMADAMLGWAVARSTGRVRRRVLTLSLPAPGSRGTYSFRAACEEIEREWGADVFAHRPVGENPLLLNATDSR